MKKKLTPRQLKILRLAAEGRVYRMYENTYISYRMERRPSVREMNRLLELKLVSLRARPDKGTSRNTETMEITGVQWDVVCTDKGLAKL